MKIKPLWGEAYPGRLKALGAACLIWGFGWALFATYGHIERIWLWTQELPVEMLALAVEFALVLGVVLWRDEIEKATPLSASRN
jgi:hypothetical protein